MQIDMTQFAGLCSCGARHELETKQILIESGAVARLGEILDSLGFAQNGLIICDGNTRPFADLAARSAAYRLHPSLPILELRAEGLHADEHAVEAVLAIMPANTAWFVAVGSGTVHDITRYTACLRQLPFISFPTAASVDGFVSAVSAMTWQGFKKTFPGIAPRAVVADSDIFSRAPYRLTASGLGDVLGKYIALTDWRISHILTGEELCERIWNLAHEAADKVRACLSDIARQDPESCEQLLYAQLLSGIAMQMWGNSRPASGSEHHLSHFWEMELINPHLDALHGEKVGIGLHVCLPFYKAFARTDLQAHLVPYAGYPETRITEKFGALYGEIAAENDPDPLLAVDPSVFVEKLPEIAEWIDALPEPAALKDEMRRAGCRTEPAEIGLSEELIPESLALSPFLRKRLTLMRLRKLTDL